MNMNMRSELVCDMIFQAYRGVYSDESGPAMGKLLKDMSDDSSFPLIFNIDRTALVPDESGKVQK